MMNTARQHQLRAAPHASPRDGRGGWARPSRDGGGAWPGRSGAGPGRRGRGGEGGAWEGGAASDVSRALCPTCPLGFLQRRSGCCFCPTTWFFAVLGTSRKEEAFNALIWLGLCDRTETLQRNNHEDRPSCPAYLFLPQQKTWPFKLLHLPQIRLNLTSLIWKLGDSIFIDLFLKLFFLQNYKYNGHFGNLGEKLDTT